MLVSIPTSVSLYHCKVPLQPIGRNVTLIMRVLLTLLDELATIFCVFFVVVYFTGLVLEVCFRPF